MVVQIKPTWKDRSKPANDKTGWKRGARGIDGAFDADGRDFMRTADPAADKYMYGPQHGFPRPDGAQAVRSKSKDPGTITNRSDSGDSRGYDGVDE